MQPLIVGNWKMNGLAAQLGELKAISKSVRALSPKADILICPPATLIERAVRAAAGSISIGGQTCHADIAGAFTGDISAEMLKDAGATAVIVGHSERRRHHGETDAIVAAKARAVRRAGLLSIICIGETKSQRLAGATFSICDNQIAGSVPEDATSSATAIGYEPLWAIGTGHIPTSEQIAETHGHIRQSLTTRLGAQGKEIRIVYGGSVDPTNAAEVLSLPEVGGALVGGASLNAKDFVSIMSAIASTG